MIVASALMRFPQSPGSSIHVIAADPKFKSAQLDKIDRKYPHFF